MEKKVQILLVEDELIIADYMEACLQKLGYEVVDTCIDYEEAIAALQQHKPDIVLVDITLKGTKTGIDVGNYIKQNLNIPFIFASSHSDKPTIDKAKQALPYSYLIKPFSEEDLYAAIETALMHFAQKQQKEKQENNDNPIVINDSIFIRHKARFVKLQFDELLYLESEENYAVLVTTKGNYALKSTLKNMLDVLPEYFWRIHKSYVINLHHLNGFDAEEVTIDKKNLPLSRGFYPLLLEKLKVVQG
jgi:two-component system, LytTR family, response regulator LytT